MKFDTIRFGSGLMASAIAALCVQSAMAAGFYLPEVGSPASLGTAGVANPTNTFHADAAWTNPAGMTGLERDSMMAGLQIVAPTVEFDPSKKPSSGGNDGGNAGDNAYVPSVYYVNKLSDRSRFGISLVAPQGGGVDYGDDFAGRYQTSKATLAVVGISPSFAWKFSDRLSVGAGVAVLYTKYEQDIMLNQGAVVPGAKDGKVKIEDATDWGYQPYVGLTWQMTDRALLGVVYRAEADVKLEGDINFRNLVIDKPKADDIELAWDNPQWLEVGLRYQFSEADFLFLNGGWQDWSEFGEKNEISTDGTTATLNREWDDTWHAGIGYAHRKPGGLGYTLGFSYDSSPVDDDKRTFDLPVDEIYKVSAGLLWQKSDTLDFSFGATLYMAGDAEIDLQAQGERVAGEFDSNRFLFIGGSLRYQF
jgi:long-chain fatty acid transport protein